jgi:hypothetical protein
MRETKNVYKILVGKSEWNQLRDLGVDEKKILKGS